MSLDEMFDDHFVKNSIEFKKDEMDSRSVSVYEAEEIMTNIDDIDGIGNGMVGNSVNTSGMSGLSSNVLSMHGLGNGLGNGIGVNGLNPMDTNNYIHNNTYTTNEMAIDLNLGLGISEIAMGKFDLSNVGTNINAPRGSTGSTGSFGRGSIGSSGQNGPSHQNDPSHPNGPTIEPTSNYNHQYNRGHSASFSLPDKLNLLSLNLSSNSSKSPSPEFINYKEFHDERTINPQQLSLEKKRKKKTKKQEMLEVQELLEYQQVQKPIAPPTVPPPLENPRSNSLNQIPMQKDYILPSSSSSPNLKQYSNFKMNNECFNAIKIWLNNDDYNHILTNPTGILHNNYKRRNSTNNVLHSNPIMPSNINLVDKRKRRKSYNSKQDLKDLKLEISLNSAIDDSPDLINQEFEEATGSKTGSSNGVQSLSTSSNYGDDETNIDEYREEVVSSIPVHNGRVLKNEPIIIPPQEDGKPFPCPNCSKQFKRSEHLKRHIRSVHSNIRPFHCKYCEKQFSRSDNLAQHLKTHYKLNSNGTTSIIYGNPNLHNRGGRRKSSNTGEEKYDIKSAGSDYYEGD